eukprot:COSAG02_NODE_3387_length_6833_cov_54.669884_4_plen_57_part_00
MLFSLRGVLNSDPGCDKSVVTGGGVQTAVAHREDFFFPRELVAWCKRMDLDMLAIG